MLVLKHRAYARRIWLAGFLSSLLVATALGAPILLVVEMHEFPEPTPEEQTYHGSGSSTPPAPPSGTR